MVKRILRIWLFLFLNLLLVAALQNKAIFQDEDTYSRALFSLSYSAAIVPGTKWCGPGDIATHYDDLGIFRETDKCCRSHDHCPELIEPGTTLHSLFNPDIFPRLRCDCEQEFMNCLYNVNSVTSNTVGSTYFGARGKCFAFTYPALQCVAYQQGNFGKRCIKYTYDVLQPMRWQYLDNPYFSLKK